MTFKEDRIERQPTSAEMRVVAKYMAEVMGMHSAAGKLLARANKQESVADERDGCGSEHRERVATSPPSPTPEKPEPFWCDKCAIELYDAPRMDLYLSTITSPTPVQGREEAERLIVALKNELETDLACFHIGNVTVKELRAALSSSLPRGK